MEDKVCWGGEWGGSWLAAMASTELQMLSQWMMPKTGSGVVEGKLEGKVAGQLYFFLWPSAALYVFVVQAGQSL